MPDGDQVDPTLGIRRRQPTNEGVGELGTKRETAAGQPRKPTGKLSPTVLQILLNFYTGRPEVEPPAFIDELSGTSGWFCGDGCPEREIQVGFRPAFVIFTAPPFPDEGRHWKGAEFYQPPLHDQPPYTDRGFMVDTRFNEAGSMCMYVVWKPKS